MENMEKKVKLTLLDRIVLNSIFQGFENTFNKVIIVKDIKKAIEVTQEELKKYEIMVSPKGGLLWNDEGTKAEFEYEFTDMESREIKLALTALDKREKLTEDHIHLYEVFVK